MEVLDAITNRRSINKLNQDVPPKELIEKILQAGNWAPTHHGTEPWRFYVITGDSRRKLGDVMANLRAGVTRLEPVHEWISKVTQ